VTIIVYVCAITLANILVWWIGPWWSPINSLILIGLDLSLRDKLHERYGVLRSIGIVVLGGAISYLVNPAAANIALASIVAFVSAGIVDAVVYQRLINHTPQTKMNGSNVAGAAVDSILFPTIAFGVFMPHIIALQFAAKVIGGAFWAKVLTR